MRNLRPLHYEYIEARGFGHQRRVGDDIDDDYVQDFPTEDEAARYVAIKNAEYEESIARHKSWKKPSDSELGSEASESEWEEMSLAELGFQMSQLMLIWRVVPPIVDDDFEEKFYQFRNQLFYVAQGVFGPRKIKR